jgi:hypothetical protein
VLAGALGVLVKKCIADDAVSVERDEGQVADRQRAEMTLVPLLVGAAHDRLTRRDIGVGLERDLVRAAIVLGASRLDRDPLGHARLDLDIGEIDTTWVVYGRQKRFKGEVIGIPSAGVFRNGAAEAARVPA